VCALCVEDSGLLPESPLRVSGESIEKAIRNEAARTLTRSDRLVLGVARLPAQALTKLSRGVRLPLPPPDARVAQRIERWNANP
jgi:hypothetical protein